MVYINELARKDDRLRVHFIAHPAGGVNKTDAFLIEHNGSFTLIDGGMKDVNAAYDYLVSLRASLLRSGAVADNDDRPLKLSWIISHFHVDHVCATLDRIIPSPLFKLETVYIPPDSAVDPKYNAAGTDGDKKYRPILSERLERYSPETKKVNIPFGKENAVTLNDGKLRTMILPPPANGGVGKRLGVIIDGYYDGDETSKMIPVAAVNSGSVWVHLKFGRHSFLFTGDTMKRSPELYEAFDEMMDTYAEGLGHVSVVKYPHHGLNRDSAAPLVTRFHPGWMVMTSENATAPAAIREQCPSSRSEIVNCGNRSYIFETDGKRMTVTDITGN